MPARTTLALALGAAAVVAGVAAAAQSITAVSWGGAYTLSQIKAYHEPFTEATGIVVYSQDYHGGLQEIRAQVQAGRVTWDLVDVALSDAIRGCEEGLLEPIDHSRLPPAPDGTPAVEDFIAGTLTECGVGQIVWSTIYAYDETRFSDDEPATIADFFDTKRYPGKRGLRKTPQVNLEWALLADGVPIHRVYEVLNTTQGIDRAFAKLATLKPDLVWWEAGAQPPHMLADGEVIMTSAYNGRIFNAQISENQSFKIVWDSQVWDIDLWVIPKGSKNLGAALEFVKFSTDTQRLADQAKYISYGPVRKSSLNLVTTHAQAGMDMQSHMPTAPENFRNALQIDFTFWAANGDELNRRFNTWLTE